MTESIEPQQPGKFTFFTSRLQPIARLWRQSGLAATVRDYANIIVALLAALIAVVLIDRGLSHFAALAVVLAFVVILYLTPYQDAQRAAADAAKNRARKDTISPLLQEIVNGLPEATIFLSSDGLVYHFNERALVHCPSIATNRHISTCIRDPGVLDAIAAAPMKTAPVTVHFMRRIPVEQRIEASVAAVHKAAGAPGNFTIITLRDLSEQESLARMRADFIANASHELRTPLASLQGFIETLQGPARNDPEARDKFLGIMAQQSKRMKRLIDDLLSLSRVEMKAHLFPNTRVELGDIVGHVIDTLEPLAAERNSTISYTAPEQQLWVRGDRDELVQVFQNLVHNAIKYGKDQGLVEVGCNVVTGGVDSQRIQIYVKDDGPGIAPEHLPRLVERFYRVDVADSRQKGGTGLGLAIVKHVLNRHRGELKIASAPGRGATFTVELPLLPDTNTLPQG